MEVVRRMRSGVQEWKGLGLTKMEVARRKVEIVASSRL
jgi:hypothetical protein